MARPRRTSRSYFGSTVIVAMARAVMVLLLVTSASTAAEQLLPLVYDELRKLAARRLA
ncbi:MAG: hypothetical protein WD738_06830 [Pirellulales bacterium]